MKKGKVWNSWPGVQISSCREAAQILAGIGNAKQWQVCVGTTSTKTLPGRGDRAMPCQGELGKAALCSQNNPPHTSNATLQIHLLNYTPKSLSSFPSQLSWERQVHGSPFCQRCSDCATATGNLPETWDRRGSLTPKNCKASYVWHTTRNSIDVHPRHTIPDRQGYLWTETTPSSFSNRKKYSDVDKSTHPGMLFLPPWGFFFPSLLLFSKLIHITCAFWFHYVRCY